MSEIQRIGIVGDGQLGRMITEAALPIGYEVTVLGTAGPDSPAAQVGARQLDGGLKDPEAIRNLTEHSDVITWEIEHINARTLIELEEEGHNVQPSPRSLHTIQDKLRQKLHLTKHGIAVAPFDWLDDADDLYDVRNKFGDDIIVKARRGGYDGRGNLRTESGMNWLEICKELGVDPQLPGLYAEKIVPFQRELSLVGARDMAGRIATYSVVETIHKDNICHTVMAPAELDDDVRQKATQLGRATIAAFQGAGVFAVEMFQDENDNVLVNEVAPRVHNSGHWTDLGAETSQFEQHVRAITGQPLGSTLMRYGAAAMVNILSTQKRQFEDYMRDTQPAFNGHIRWYGKAPKADGSDRKIGHVTAVGDEIDDVLERAQALHQYHTNL